MAKTLINITLFFLLSACTVAPTPTINKPATKAPNQEPTLATNDTLETKETTDEKLVSQVLDDFEASSTNWLAGQPPEYTDSSATEIKLSNTIAVQGIQSLAISFNKGERDRAFFILEKQLDLSDGKFLAFDLVDPEQAVEAIAISVNTGEDWYWYESSAVKLPPDATQITFDIEAKNYGTANSEWQPTEEIANREDVKRLVVIVYPKNTGTAYIDNLRLLSSEALVSLSPTIQPQAMPTSSPTTSSPQVLEKCPGKTDIPESSEALVILLPTDSDPKYGSLVEFNLQTSLKTNNPYDPEEIDLMVHYTAPDGSQFSVPAFWMQDFDPNSEQACGQAGWKARLTPTLAGEWTAQAEIIDEDIQSEAITFDVTKPNEEPLSIIRLHPTDSRYFSLENGETFFPIGINIGWWQAAPLEDYTQWLDRLSANGGNLIRVWMASWSFGIEWNDTGLGNYEKRQYQAWLLDQLFQIASERGVYIELVLINHGAFSARVNPEWSLNPYNSDNGGPCDVPQCFVTDPTARQYFKRRLRYIAARWGYAPNLMAWEWWNEYNWTPINEELMAPWTQEMSIYLQQYDPYDHLVSTSTAGGIQPLVFNLPEIDFLQHHAYTSADPITNFALLYRPYEKSSVSGKPVLFAEFGYDTSGEDPDAFDRDGIHLHNGLWAATFSQFASPAMYWWWDNYVDPLDLWWQFGGLSNFIKDEDLAKYKPLASGKFEISTDTNIAQSMALYSEETNTILGWIRQTTYNAYDAQYDHDSQVRYNDMKEEDWEYHLEPIKNLEITITALPDGKYTLEWYEPSSATWQPPRTVTIQDKSLTLEVPEFNIDVAIRIQMQP